VTYGNEANIAQLKTKTVGLTPGVSENGDVIWACGYGSDPNWFSDTATDGVTDVVGKFLPTTCR
jgi:hypothetical protein